MYRCHHAHRHEIPDRVVRQFRRQQRIDHHARGCAPDVLAVERHCIEMPLASLPHAHVPLVVDRVHQKMERHLDGSPDAQDLSALQTEIHRISDAISHLPVPVNYIDRYYELRAAVELVKNRIESRV